MNTPTERGPDLYVPSFHQRGSVRNLVAPRNWLTGFDMLLGNHPYTRVTMFGYDVNGITDNPFSPTETAPYICREILEKIREQHGDVPYVLVEQSLGALVLMEVMDLASKACSRFRPIFEPYSSRAVGISLSHLIVLVAIAVNVQLMTGIWWHIYICLVGFLLRLLSFLPVFRQRERLQATLDRRQNMYLESIGTVELREQIPSKVRHYGSKKCPSDFSGHD